MVYTLLRCRAKESAKKCGAIRQRMPRSRVSCPVHGSGETLLTLANCLSTTVSVTLSTIPVEAPDCHSGVGWPSVGHVAIYPHESGTAPHFLALPVFAAGAAGSWPVSGRSLGGATECLACQGAGDVQRRFGSGTAAPVEGRVFFNINARYRVGRNPSGLSAGLDPIGLLHALT